MKVLQNLIAALVVVFVLAGAIVYFLPREFSVSSSIVIDQPAEIVYGCTSNFNLRKSWGPGLQTDPKAIVSVEGEPGEAGHKMEWNSAKSGAGTITVLSSTAGQNFQSRFDFAEPKSAPQTEKWEFKEKGGKTVVTWTVTGGLPFPAGRIKGLFINQELGEFEKRGLENLKKICEAIPKALPVATTDTTTTAQPM